MNYEIVKGSKDYEPEEQIKINFILEIIKKNFEKYGFRPLDTPILEHFETLAGKYEEGSEILDEIYSLKDRGERNLGLRYDLTVPFCRYISSKKQLKLPFRRYSFGKVFRDGPLKKGRLREFIQCDADIVGIEGIEVEAEILELFSKTYNDLKIDSIIEINNNKLLKGIFLQFGFKNEDLDSLILSVDKLKKIGIDNVIKEIKLNGFDEVKARKAINILVLNNFENIKKISENEILKKGVEELEKLSFLLKELNINFRINFSMSRGLNIYSGNIWEVYKLDKNITSSLGAGGRYDNIIGTYSKNDKSFPAVGISFGLIPILECIEKENKKSNIDILIVPLNKDLILNSFNIANKLRDKKKKVEVSYCFKIKKAFSYAEYLNIDNIVFFGNKDLENKTYTIKNLKDKSEIVKNL